MQNRKAVATRFFSLGVSLFLVLGLMIVPHNAQAGVTKVSLLDACIEFDDVFRAEGQLGLSDIPEFMKAFAILNIAKDGQAILTVVVNKSAPDAEHEVFSCDQAGDYGSFSPCHSLGVFTTNINGDGAFHMEFETFYDWNVIALNTEVFDTILANDAVTDPINGTPAVIP